MKTKDELSQERYGCSYKDCYWIEKSWIEGKYEAEKKQKQNGNS